MITAHKIKILQSLDKKKFRQKYNLFLVEGNKTIKEIPNSPYKIAQIYSVSPEALDIDQALLCAIKPEVLKKISFLQNPKDSVAVCELKQNSRQNPKGVRLILDGVQDPGNLGTIIRLADWFGISEIICSEDTADFYNPKVIQSSMGSFLRVNIVYENLVEILEASKNAVIGTNMIGGNIYGYDFPDNFDLVLGNEGQGITPQIKELLTDQITIPRFGPFQTTESLNVAMSAGIILSQIFAKK